MKLFKIYTFIFLLILGFTNVIADEEEKAQNIVEKAKEINQKVKKKQAEKDLAIKEAGIEEPLPLNDPFVGDASLGGQSTVSVVTNNEDERALLSLYKSYVSLINSSGEIVTIQMNEELSPGVKLVGLDPKRALFEKGSDSYLVINFKNQIKETSEPF